MKYFDDFDTTMTWIKKHGKTIGDNHSNGDKEATQIMKTYGMVHSSPGDPGAKGILMSLCEKYEEKHSLEAS